MDIRLFTGNANVNSPVAINDILTFVFESSILKKGKRGRYMEYDFFDVNKLYNLSLCENGDISFAQDNDVRGRSDI